MSESKFTIDKENLTVSHERLMPATPDRLWQAYTDPEQIAQWWGPRKYTITIEEYDVRVGGKWRMIHSHLPGEGGPEKFVFYGEFLEVDEPHKISQTFIYEVYADTVINETISFEPVGDGQTLLKTVSHFPNVEALQGMVDSGMQWGVTESFDRLTELVS